MRYDSEARLEWTSMDLPEVSEFHLMSKATCVSMIERQTISSHTQNQNISTVA